MYVTVAWPKLGFFQHSGFGVGLGSSSHGRFGHGHPFWYSSRGSSGEGFADGWPDDGSGRSLVGYYPHLSLELGGDDDDAFRLVCVDGASVWRDPY